MDKYGRQNHMDAYGNQTDGTNKNNFLSGTPDMPD